MAKKVLLLSFFAVFLTLFLANVRVNAQPAAPTSVTATAGDTFITVSFTSTDVNAVTFQVTVVPTRFYPAPNPRLFFGAVTGPDGMVANGASDTVLDTARYTAVVPLSTNPCPLPFTTTSLCLTTIAYITTATRLTTMVAFHGAVMNINSFMNWAGGLSAAPAAIGGVPILAPIFDFPTNAVSRMEFNIVGFPVAYDWNRFSFSGILLYDTDNLGRIRPLFKSGLYEYLGYHNSYYATCATATSCSWTTIGGTFSIGGSTTTAPTTTAPWIYGITRDPIAGTWQPRHVHPTFGTWTTAPVFLDSQFASLGGFWYSNYVNSATFGLFNVSRVRAALYVESQSGSGNSWGYTVNRVTVNEIISSSAAAPRVLWGTTTGTDGISVPAGSSTAIDTTRFTFYGAPGSAPFCPVTSGCSAASITDVVARVARIRGNWGALMNIGAFLTFGGATGGVPSASAPSAHNGIPMLEGRVVIPTNETTRISAVITGFTDAYDWNRYSWSGLMLFDLDNLGRVRPVFKTGMYEWLGYFAFWYVNCPVAAPTTCTWTQLGGTFSIGGSVTTAPTVAAPWLYTLERNPFAQTWAARHRHSTSGEWTAGPVFADASLPSLAAAYFTNYLNNPTFGTWSWSNARVAAFMEVQSGGGSPTTTMGYWISHFNVQSTIETYLANLRVEESTIVTTTTNTGTRCGYMSTTVTTATRAASCTGNSCTVRAEAPNNGVAHSVSVVAVDSTSVQSSVVNIAGSYTPQPTLPISGAQMFLDANSMAGFVGGAGSTCPSITGQTCQPTLFWRDMVNGYAFSNVPTLTARPQLKMWAPASPFNSIAFDGVDDAMYLDLSNLGRDAEFEMQFPDQPGFNAANDAQTTWFMLYQPTEATVLTGTRTVFGKGLPAGAGGSSYIYYQQRATANPIGQTTLYDQQQGFAVAANNQGLGTVLGQKYRVSSNSFIPNPHAAAPTLVTIMHYRNNSGGLLSNRAYRLDACEGVETGAFATDRCSFSVGTSPADRWLSPATDAMGTNILRQAGLPTGTIPGSNIVDYNLSTSAINNQRFPRASGVFGIGTTYDGGLTPVASYFRGQLMALVSYRRSLNATERRSVQEYILNRYNQLCPALPAPPGATSGCPAAASGFTCTVNCDGSATPPRARVGGNSILTCLNGAWQGKMPLCLPTCAPRSSPRDYATCTQTYGEYTFTDSVTYPVPTTFTSLPQFDVVTPFQAPASLLDSAWSISRPSGYANGLLIGAPILQTGCNPARTGALFISENNPDYVSKMSAGQRMIAETQFRLMADGTQAGIAVRVSGALSSRSAYMVVLGLTTTGSNNYIALNKMTSGLISTLSVTPLSGATVPFWDLTGLSSATPITLRVTISSFSATVLSQVINVDLVSSLSTVRVFSFTDSLAPLSIGSAGLIVNSGRAAFEYLTVQGDCDSSGAVCNLYSGQSCQWTCSNGTVPGVGSNFFVGSVYRETCSSSGAMPAAAQQFSCIPLPPTIANLNVSIKEDAVLGTVLGKLVSSTVNPRHVALYTIPLSPNNTEVVKDKYGAIQGTVTEVFGVGACSGDIVLNRGGTISFDQGKRLYTLIVTGCTNGHPLACSNTTVTVNILNVPSAPYFLRDPDTNNDSPWVRSVFENSAVGTLLRSSNSLSVGMNITATSPEGSPLTYDIPFGNSLGLFFIEPTTGTLRVATASIDYENFNQYAIIVRATDTIYPTLSGSVQIQISVIDRNDPPIAVTPQYVSVREDAALAGLIGSLRYTDQDLLDNWNVTWIGTKPSQLSVNVSGGNVDVYLTSTLTYPPPETSPVFVWQSKTVREVFYGQVRVTDQAGASTTINFEVGILTAWTPGNDPVATTVNLPSSFGLRTSGSETITISGQYFNTIKTTYSNIVNATIYSQRDDPYPNRAYNCTSCRVVDDATITCITPAGWGSNLILQLVYGTTRRNMASTAPLFISYRLPVVSAIAGRNLYPTDLTLGTHDSLDTNGGELLLLTASDLGLQDDALSILQFEYGLPVPGTDNLEYVSQYVPCPLYEVWATPSNPGGFDTFGNSRICIRSVGGIGRILTYKIRVGTQASNVSQFSAVSTNWYVSYKAPTLSRVWKPINLNGDFPPTWNTLANAGTVSTLGDDLIYFNGSHFGPMDRMPMVTFYSVFATSNEGVTGVFYYNYTPALRVDGKPNCWKPNPTMASSLMACATPPGAGQNLRVRLQVGNQQVLGSTFLGYSYAAPNVTGISGTGAKNGDTSGGQTLVISGINFGPLPAKFTASYMNAYLPTSGTPNSLASAAIPISVTYGRVGTEYLARNCKITFESPSEITCDTAAGVGRDFTYRLIVGGQTAPLLFVSGTGYAPPLLSSITRLPTEVTYDPILDAIPGAKDFSTSGNESIVISGKNFGPCPAGSPPCALTNPAYLSVQYYVKLDDVSTDFGITLGDANKEIWFNATDCVMTVVHTQIICKTAIGAGTNAVVRVTVAGQSSVLPTTSYDKPSITAISVQTTGGSALTAASPDGGDVVVITGANFGPRLAATCVNLGGSIGTRCRGMIQSITFGPTGMEHSVTDWNIPSAASSTHNTVHAFLPPGIGTNLRVIVTVADQVSLVSTASFSFEIPIINSVTPGNGPTDPTELLPVFVTLTGYNFAALSSTTEIQVLFGNPEDRTLLTGVPIVKVYPDRKNPTEVAAYLATAVPRLETVTFRLPTGLGLRRAIRVTVTDKRTGDSGVPIYSNAVFFDYNNPSIQTVVVESLQQYIDNNASLGFTPEYEASSKNFAAADVARARRLTLLGVNFGRDQFADLQRNVEYADGAVANASMPDTDWMTAAVGLDMFLYSWSTDRVVLLTTLSSAWIRVNVAAQQFSPPVNPVTGLPDPVYLNSISEPYRFDDLSPAIGNLVGTPGPFATLGGDIISFTVRNLVSVSTSITATVDGAPCPLVYAPTDTARGAGNVVPANKLRDDLVFNVGGGFAYYDTATPSVDSTWTLYCRLPAGEGSAARLVIARDNILSGELPIEYSAPSITSIDIWDNSTSQWVTQSYTPGVTYVRIPTLGTPMRVTGTNFGVCPGVFAGYHLISMDVLGCNATRLVQADSTGSHTYLTFTVPEGEGSNMFFSVVAGDQSSLDMQPIGFEYAVPSISHMTMEGRTAGGDMIHLHGTNFGVNPPEVYINNIACTNVNREWGTEGHSHIWCTLPEGSGGNLPVRVTVAGTQSTTVNNMFSYSLPVVNTVTVYPPASVFGNTTVYDFTNPNTTNAAGGADGNYKVVIEGDNFGARDYSTHCLFIAWRGRNRLNPFTCDNKESFVGEGEVPLLALEEFEDSLGQIQWSHTSITVLFPPGTGVRDIIVFVNNQVPSSPPVFRYNAPVITNDLYPNRGPTSGGTKLSVLGYNFGFPVLDTATAQARAIVNAPRNLPSTLNEYLNQNRAPESALVIRFGRGCVSNYLTASGIVPSYLSACEQGVLSHNPGELSFLSAGGIGANRSVSVAIYDVQPTIADPNQLEVIIIESNALTFSYDPPTIILSRPRPVPTDGVSKSTFSVIGINFGSLIQSVSQGWTEEEKAVNMTVGNVPVLSAVRAVVSDASQAKVDTINVEVGPLTVGYHNLSYIVAGQPGFTSAEPSRAALLVGCAPGTMSSFKTDEMGPFGGYFGRPGETCLPCPAGAICVGFDSSRANNPSAIDPGQHMYPIPVQGFYNLNSSDTLTTGMNAACPDEVRSNYPDRDVCIVRCEPANACLGDNQCAPEYVSIAPYFRCSTCAPGFYKRATECIKCPDSPWALVIGFTLLVIVGGGLAYMLNRLKINIAYIAIAIDYFQVLAIFAMARVSWPPMIQELFHVLSAFNLNIEIVAPECIVPNLGFQRKWSFVMALPVSLQVFFAVVTALAMGYKVFVKGQKVRTSELGGSMMSSVLMVMYLLYIYLTRNILDVFNCKPTDPPDGKTYLTVVFEECGKPGGVQVTLLPAAVVATIVYIIGYPAGVTYLLWKNRETVMEDQLLRAKGVGDDRLTNPHAYGFRKRWGRLYYQFRPDAIFWVLAIIVRKFCIAATFILFNNQPSFQMAATFLVIFLSYSAQMRFNPYMSPGDFEFVLKDHERQSFSDPVHARLRATLSGITTRTRKQVRRNMLNAEGTVDSAAVLGVLRGWLFNYNTVEQLMLFSAGIVSMMGLMFAAQARKSAYYRDSRDAIASVTIAIVAISIIYLFVVFVTEIVILAGEQNRRQQAAKADRLAKQQQSKKSASDKKQSKADDEVIFDAGDVDSTTNPMFIGAKSDDTVTAFNAAEASAVIENMREPPASVELWSIYKSMFEELANTVDTLRTQVESNKSVLDTPLPGSNDDAESEYMPSSSPRKTSFTPKGTLGTDSPISNPLNKSKRGPDDVSSPGNDTKTLLKK